MQAQTHARTHVRVNERARDRSERERERESSAISFEPSPASKVRHARKYACGAFRLTLRAYRGTTAWCNVHARPSRAAHGFENQGLRAHAVEKERERGFGRGGGHVRALEPAQTRGLFREREVRSRFACLPLPVPACLPGPSLPAPPSCSDFTMYYGV